MFTDITWNYDKNTNNFTIVKSFDSIVNICMRYGENSVIIGTDENGIKKTIEKSSKKHTVIFKYKNQSYKLKQEIIIIPGINFDFEMAVLMYFKNIANNQEFSYLVEYLRNLLKWRTTKKRLAQDIVFEANKTTLKTNYIPPQILKIFTETIEKKLA